MKFWQLISAFRKYDEQLSTILLSDQWYQPYGEWYKEIRQIVIDQDREKLDSELPSDLVLGIAHSIGGRQVFYKNENVLRICKLSPDDTKLTLLEVVERYGGSKLEEVMEKGSCHIES